MSPPCPTPAWIPGVPSLALSQPRGLGVTALLGTEAVSALAPGRCEGPRGTLCRPRHPAVPRGQPWQRRLPALWAGCPAQAADILEGNSSSLLLPVVRSQRNGRPGARLCRLRPPRAVAGLSRGRRPSRAGREAVSAAAGRAGLQRGLRGGQRPLWAEGRLSALG